MGPLSLLPTLVVVLRAVDIPGRGDPLQLDAAFQGQKMVRQVGCLGGFGARSPSYVFLTPFAAPRDWECLAMQVGNLVSMQLFFLQH